MPELLTDFEEQRDHLSRLAYRILGTRADADDVLQEAFLRWNRTERDDVRSPRAFLSTMVTRLCIDRRREIEARKETYVGPWLPEPIVEFDLGHPEPVEMAETVSLALLHVLESLSAAERAAYLLRVMFDYDYSEIARILEKSEPTCRQLVSRAQAHVQAERPRFEASADDVQRITDQFLSACSTGNLDGLVQLLHDDAVMLSDGGGKATAALAPILGGDRIGRFFLGIFRKMPANARVALCRVNGMPGYAMYADDKLATIMATDIRDGRIQRIFMIRNPDKLARVSSNAPA
ncbi:RNA polymerase sigma factor SigJ [Anatilimnocola floriformis]|uniref:RNA polymerase sigma factor SigJ n=1 Tax=Anatilimnocola floriformis TaxID=2948575 RepID=UPI0020C2E1A8|nr:RNA polymerase sigma factor SigJ [Anatilimnocola floriformis]